MAMVKRLINREISWLSFNKRVLQEAADPTVPLIERIRFLGIFSNNQDEFFRVRVATVKRMIGLKRKITDFIGGTPQVILNEIQESVIDQQREFGVIYQSILDEMARNGVHKLNEKQLTKAQGNFVREYFRNKVFPSIIPIMLNQLEDFPYLKDKSIYLAACIQQKEKSKKFLYALIEIPSNLPRFIVIPGKEKATHWIMMDDVIRYSLDMVFSVMEYKSIKAYTIKITRDAEMDLDDDVSKSFLEKMKKSLNQRKKGAPVRLVYDEAMPRDLLRFFMKRMKLDNQDNLIPGGRYHNFKDFMKFPNVGPDTWVHPKAPPLPHPDLKGKHSVFEVLRKKDVLLHYPYQSFDHFLDFMREAAIDPKVKWIKIALYRVASHSNVINALINAAKNGKEVMVVVELQARFDEEANIYWANVLQEEGVKVIFGFPGFKVHSKLCLIGRKEVGGERIYASIGTGNFNESTARIYSDFSLLTANQTLTREADQVFDFFSPKVRPNYYFRKLLISPTSTRSRFVRMINTEIKHAKAGQEAYIILKMNSLVDPQMVRKLYAASQAGVKIKLIVRGMCSLIPGVKGLSENIEAFSIVDKYLEHARVYVFCNGGDPAYFISSADWMTRNLDHRIEITCPVTDSRLQQELKDFLEIQMQDNVKARILDEALSNTYKKPGKTSLIRSQEALYAYYKKALISSAQEA